MFGNDTAMNVTSVHPSQSNFKLTYVNISDGVISASELIQNGHYNVEREMPAVFNACSESSLFTEVQLCCGFLIFGEAHRRARGVGRHEAEAVVGCSSQPAQISFHFKLSV